MTKRTHGLCPICGHYGSDCTGPHENTNAPRHTPGPWHAHSETGYRWTVKDAQGRNVITGINGYPHDDDYARLIAAAPDLLAALSAIAQADAKARAMPDYRTHPDFAELRASISAARSAIAKAEG